MSDEAEIKQEEIAKILDDIKMGKKFNVGDFSSVDEAEKFASEFIEKLPRYDDKALSEKEEQIKNNQKEVASLEKDYQNKSELSSAADMLSTYVSESIPQMADGVGGYKFEYGQDGKPKNPLPKEQADICYGYLKECMKAGLEAPFNEEESVKNVKTPYEKLPSEVRRQYESDVKNGKTPDAKVDMLKKCDNVCQAIRSDVGNAGVLGQVVAYGRRDRDVKAAEGQTMTPYQYLQEITKTPNNEMSSKLEADSKSMPVEEKKAEDALKEAKVTGVALEDELRSMTNISKLVGQVEEVMQSKVFVYKTVELPKQELDAKAEELKNKKEEISALLKDVKYGEKFKVGDFESVDEAKNFADEFGTKLPSYSEEVLSEKNKEIEGNDKKLVASENDARNKSEIKFSADMLLNYTQRYIPQMMDGVGGYKFEYGEDDKPKNQLPKKLADICYGYLKECVQVGVDNPCHEMETVSKIKTPYKKLPLRKRLKYQLDVKLGRKPDPEVALLKRCDFACSTIRRHVASPDFLGWNFYHTFKGREPVNNEGEEKVMSPYQYMQEMAKIPNEEMVARFSDDLVHFTAQEERADAVVQGAKNKGEALRGEVKAMTDINALVGEVGKAMQAKVETYEKTHDPKAKVKAKQALSEKGIHTWGEGGKDVHWGDSKDNPKRDNSGDKPTVGISMKRDTGRG